MNSIARGQNIRLFLAAGLPHKSPLPRVTAPVAVDLGAAAAVDFLPFSSSGTGLRIVQLDRDYSALCKLW
jgi:hypothetical protein